MCVRRDGVSQSVAAVDAGRLRIDAKILQAALSAGHPPSDDLDSQFPAEAASGCMASCSSRSTPA
jgi:hypothetical protein